MSVNKVKVIANYLPQYHTIPENDKWWGKGFTDWIAVKATEPAYEGHNQPRVPLNENYYSLDCADSIFFIAHQPTGNQRLADFLCHPAQHFGHTAWQDLNTIRIRLRNLLINVVKRN